VEAFGTLARGRPVSMGGMMPIPPMDIIGMAEKLQWPCEPDECLQVITEIDDDYRERAQKN
jgi:hypothetical protein